LRILLKTSTGIFCEQMNLIGGQIDADFYGGA
jgi:hypothetical protein